MNLRPATILPFPILFILSLCSAATANGLPEGNPQDLGLSPDRLARIETVMNDYVNQGVFPGMTVSIARKGKIAYFKTFGFRDVETREPVSSDSVYRIYSMTKPVTAVALMTLFEEGLFLLDDPVSKYIPAFKEVSVFKPDSSERDRDSVPKREMTIRDLFTHTSGLGYGWDNGPVSRRYRELKIIDPQITLEESVNRLARAPLYFEPGSNWRYSLSIDVLGRIAEVLSGSDLESFLKDRLFTPLGMNDTGFYVSPEQEARLTNVYQFNPSGGLSPLPRERSLNMYQREHNKLLSGGGGLVSTAADYLRFAQMLLNGGELKGIRLLSPRTVELMQMDHLPPGVHLPWDKLRGHGHGFGMTVLKNIPMSLTVGSEGDFGWDGAASTYFRIDPKEDLVILLMTHRMPCDTEIQAKLKTLVYQALVD